MKITTVLERRSVLAIYCDGERWREVHTSVFGRTLELPQGCDSQEALEALFSLLEYRCAKEYALRRLNVQAMPSARLAASLKQRLVAPHTIEKVVAELTAAGYLNDASWAASFVRVQSRRHVGPRAIVQKLAGKGLRGGVVEDAMGGAWNETAQRDAISHLLATRYRQRNLSDRKEQQKVVAALARRGFSLDLIFEQLNRPEEE